MQFLRRIEAVRVYEAVSAHLVVPVPICGMSFLLCSIRFYSRPPIRVESALRILLEDSSLTLPGSAQQRLLLLTQKAQSIEIDGLGFTQDKSLLGMELGGNTSLEPLALLDQVNRQGRYRITPDSIHNPNSTPPFSAHLLLTPNDQNQVNTSFPAKIRPFRNRHHLGP